MYTKFLILFFVWHVKSNNLPVQSDQTNNIDQTEINELNSSHPNLTTDEVTHEPEPEISSVKNIATQAAVKSVIHSLKPTRRNQIYQPSFFMKLKFIILKFMIDIKQNSKVITVLSNIGTCVVNGVMEIISHFVPPPLVPLIASAAGMMIPFEPVVMLKQRMPINSYRRALNTAVNGFLGTFDKYKVDDEDPYMTRRFNRRFMGDSKEKKVKLFNEE